MKRMDGIINMRGDCVKVSVIIPVYNTAEYLRECLDHIAAQTEEQIEVICVDDGSSDGSGSILDEYADTDARFQVIHKQNQGVTEARKTGLSCARGEYVCFVDSDDWIETDMLEVLLNSIDDSDLISFGVFREEVPGHVEKKSDRFPPGVYRGRKELDRIWGGMIYDFQTDDLQALTPWCVNKLYRRELAKEVIKDVDTRITYAEDSVFLYRYILRCSSVRIMKESFYHYRYRRDSAVHSIDRNMLTNINRVFANLEAAFMGHEMEHVLMRQLQRYVAAMTCIAISVHMGFDSRIVSIPRFLIDTGGIGARRVVLYGAGQTGQDGFRLLK